MLEQALWSAVRALEEQMMLSRRIFERARRNNQTHVAMTFEKRAREAEEYTSVLRQLLLHEERGDIGEPILTGDD